MSKEIEKAMSIENINTTNHRQTMYIYDNSPFLGVLRNTPIRCGANPKHPLEPTLEELAAEYNEVPFYFC